MTQEEQQEIDRICSQAADRITELEAQLSSKDQELEDCKFTLASNALISQKRSEELASLRAENEKLKNLENMHNEAIKTQSRDNDVLRKRCEDLEAKIRIFVNCLDELNISVEGMNLVSQHKSEGYNQAVIFIKQQLTETFLSQ